MKTKKQKITLLILLFVGVCVFRGCETTGSETMGIYIQNDTDSVVHVRLFPKEKYMHGKTEYWINDGSGGSLRDIEFDLGIGGNRILFRHPDITIEPHTLAKNVFDSIYISTENKDHVIIKFTHDTVIGYFENIFTENSTWDFRIEEADKGHKTLTLHRYTFLILENKLLIEKKKQP
jgi:hypothetical protein